MKPWRLMRFRSFRLRIALLSGVVSGVALVCFGGLTFAVMQRINLARMDEDIKEFSHKHLTQPHGPRHWERVGDSLRFFLGDEEENAFILLVKDRDGTLDFISANWPEELATDDFPSPDAWGSYPDVETPPRPRGRDYSNPYPPGSRGRYEEQGPPDRPQARLVGPFAADRLGHHGSGGDADGAAAPAESHLVDAIIPEIDPDLHFVTTARVAAPAHYVGT